MEILKEERVCVTGGSGFIGSWLVHLLLQRGYIVHATVKDLNDERETKHLKAFEGAESRLHLFQINLVDYGSVCAAIEGTIGVFHLASPCILYALHPENELLRPAIEGTRNVLVAAKEFGIRRIVLTSSTAAIHPNPNRPTDSLIDEDCWADIEFCKQNKAWYPVAKTLAEKAAWEIAKEKDLDLVVVNPGVVLGPILPPTINSSFQILLNILEGRLEPFEEYFMGVAHVRDVAMAHILVYENTNAVGRHICVEGISHYRDFVDRVARLYPQFEVPSLQNTSEILLKAKDVSKKLVDLGQTFVSMDQIIRDSVESLRCKGLI